MTYEIKKYPDNSGYITLNSTSTCTFIINSYEDLWYLNHYVDAYNNCYKAKPIVTIPNLIDAQADRRFNRNQSSGLKLVCNFLNRMNAHFKIFHPHNPEVVEALIDNVQIIDNSNFIHRILSNLQSGVGYFNPNLELKGDLILMSSDAGGFKPLMKLCDQINWKGETYSASKARTKDGMKQLVDREDFGGKDILIVDDICVYGGTFKGLSKLLRKRNCGKLYLAISHMTVQELGEDPVTNYFDKVFTTNSKYDKYVLEYSNNLAYQPENLEIIKLF